MIPADGKGEIQLAELRQARGQELAPRGGQTAELSFDDLVDTLNPLHHIPGVASVYREITGDEISGHAQVAGSTLYGGPMGMLSGALQAAMTEESGQSMMASLAGLVTGEHGESAEAGEQRQVAHNDAAQQTDPGARAASATAGDSGAGGAGAPGSTGQTGAAPAAATAALPTGIESVLPSPGEAASANARAARATGDAGQARGAGPETGRSANGEVLEGENALAAFARDMQSAANPSTEDGAGSAAEAGPSPADTASARDGRAQSSQQAAADHDFMKLRESDYNTSAEMRARSDRLDELQAQAANDVTPRVNVNNNVDDDDSRNGRRTAPSAAGPDTAGAPSDFASRMKEALQKYRAMHKSDE